ncbi:aspartic proteinase nepenthesin-1-like [Chenopodium quinoa]|uniref:aspartic proteinase nepenthesin-1-like n=1 Tax=Chenopodium quinoa TaxID=63459 RepID=UPI000B78DFEA|nr:aspartic proteinase nepenthesin-1-like [Chenopodium quinoa]
MIHRYSPESPTFRANLTEEDKIKEYVQSSISRFNSLGALYGTKNISSSTKSSYSTDEFILPTIHGFGLYYYVQLGIGSFEHFPSYKTYNFELDTGNDLTWMQCEGCGQNCFHQTDAPYPASQSRTYKPYTCNQCPYAYGARCQSDGACTWNRTYGDGSSLIAILASETFSTLFQGSSPNSLIVQLQNVTFGCGINMQNFNQGSIKNNRINGKLGMGNGEFSFLNQVRAYFKGVFSYCLPFGDSTLYLRFGDDAMQLVDGLQKTTIKLYPSLPRYYLDLQGITVDSTLLDIDPKVFAFNEKDITGGCIIDPVPMFSTMASEPYSIMASAVIHYIESANSNVRRLNESETFLGLKICYEQISTEPDIVYFPTIIFHFANATAFVLSDETTFISRISKVTGNYIYCFTMLDSSENVDTRLTVLGAQQQKSHRIVYDVDNALLYFNPAPCYGDN